MKSVKYGIIAGSGILLVVILMVVLLADDDHAEYSCFEVQRGQLEILVTVTGELEAERNIEIKAPEALQSRNVRLRSVLIQDMVSEGTLVEEGDWVATLDRTEAELSLRDLEEQMLSEQAHYNATILDTTITLSNLRDDLINLEYEVEERRLVLGQSAYEPPATIRQAEIDLERAKRNLEQARENYVLYELDAAESVKEAALDLERRTRRYQALNNVMDQFVITAPQSGMVIYHREWSGEKRKVGSTIHSRDLTVAVIPELNTLVSRTYVNEIDINLVVEGQPVRVGFDAFPERVYSGRVVEVSNVGQEMPGTDVKVFEVMVLIDQADNILRPAMTTSNAIIAGQFDDVHYVPHAAVHETEGISYVYKNDGTRQVVVTGDYNDNFIIIEQGLEEGDLVYLETPETGETFDFVGNELIADS
ncbi:MAG: HlyD family efflux transporter periplasmic adaptor subunit [Bacteroidales bacterium]